MYFLIEILRRAVYRLHRSKVKTFAGRIIRHGVRSRLKPVRKCAEAVIKCQEDVQNYFKGGFNIEVLDADGEREANEESIHDQTPADPLSIHVVENITSYPKITIVTPNFNQGRFLEGCIQAVLSQNYPNLEYIVIDGGSTDNSLDVIKRYEEKITYWVSEKDKGQADAINKGLHRATGEIFNWLNSDDRLTPGALFRCVEAFFENPDAAGWVGACSRVNEEGDVEEIVFPNGLERDNIGQNWNGKQFYQPSCFLSTKKVKEVGGMNPDLFIAMDLDLWLRILENGRFVAGKGIWSEAITHDSAKTQRYTEKMTQETVSLQRKYGFIEGAEKRLRAFKGHGLEYSEPDSLRERFPRMRDSAGTLRMMSERTAAFWKRKDLCFIADFDSKHDLDAVLYFLRNIFPHILRKDWTEFHIIGENARKHGARLKVHNVRFIDAGSNREELLSRYKLFVCPAIHEGGREKILLAAAAGLPIVTTTIGAEGLPVRDGEECFIADSPMEFGEKCNQCLHDPIAWHNFSIKAKLMAAENFNHLVVSAGRTALCSH